MIFQNQVTGLMYADDTTLFCNFGTTCNSEKINSELEKYTDGYVPTNYPEMLAKQSLRAFTQHNELWLIPN